MLLNPPKAERRPRWRLASPLMASVVAVAGVGCGDGGDLTLEKLEGRVYRHAALADTLEQLGNRYSGLVDVIVLGETQEKRALFAVKVAGNADAETPSLLAVFAQHAAEHTMTNLAVDLIRELAARYGVDDRTTKALNESTVWIVPMANPDGVDFDLSGEVEPYSWRKNRVPTDSAAVGVDLNRNWARVGRASPPVEQISPASDHYWGPTAFSENETRAIRDFIEAQPDLRMFLDYHTGSGGFVQGVLGCWMPRERMSPAAVEACETLIDGFAEAVSDPGSHLPPFQVTEEPEEMVNVLHEHAPFFLRPLLPDSLPSPAGISTDYASGERNIPGIGLEIDRDRPRYFEEFPQSQENITERHVRALLFLLEGLLLRGG